MHLKHHLDDSVGKGFGHQASWPRTHTVEGKPCLPWVTPNLYTCKLWHARIPFQAVKKLRECSKYNKTSINGGKYISLQARNEIKSINSAGLQYYFLSLSHFGGVEDTLDTGLHTGCTGMRSSPALLIRWEQNNCGLHELISKPRKIRASEQELCSDGETRESWRNTEVEPQELWDGPSRGYS